MTVGIFSNKTKELFQSIGGIFLALIMIFIGLNMIKTSRLNLQDSERISGVVMECGITSKMSGGRFNVNSDIFYIKLNSTEQIFGIYNKEQNYSDFESNIKYQDFITINFLPERGNLNIEIVQILKADKVVYDIHSFESKERLGGVIALIGGIVILGFIIFANFRKKRKHCNPEEFLYP